MADSIQDPILREAAGLEPDVAAALTSGDFLNLPTFTSDFSSKNWPALNGPVVLRYPTLSDLIKIESIAATGGYIAELYATLTVLIEKAPGSWYQKREDQTIPVLALGRIPDDQALLALFRAFGTWRDSFRTSS